MFFLRFTLLVLLVTQSLFVVTFSAFADNPSMGDYGPGPTPATGTLPDPSPTTTPSQQTSNNPPSDASSSSGPCAYHPDASVSEMLGGCQPDHVLTAEGYDIKGGARNRFIALANQIITVGSLIAIGVIVYAGFLYVTAVGDDERIKAGKNALKFGVIGFVVMLISFPLVNAIVKLFYDIGS